MKTSLSTKLFLLSGILLIILTLSSFGILYRAQNQLVTHEIDNILNHQSFALSALVSARPNGEFDFEISPSLLSEYQQMKAPGFFRFVRVSDNHVLQESLGAPSVSCKTQDGNFSSVQIDGGETYRVKSLVFRPEIDDGLKNAPVFIPPQVCLMVGIDEAPYRLLVTKTLSSTIHS